MDCDMDESYQAWIAHCFDHPVREPAWHFDVDAPVWSATPAVAVAPLTRLFLSPSAVLAPYSDEQINQGLWCIAHAGNSDFVFSIVDATLPVTDRMACVIAMTGLYDDLFAPRCAPTLGHASDGAGGERPLNSACYMWWDLLPMFACPADTDRATLDLVALAVMRHALQMDSIACQESALHGLGHWAVAYPAVVQTPIDAFLERGDVDPAIRQYALNARDGHLL
jgi:hypothetical protein